MPMDDSRGEQDLVNRSGGSSGIVFESWNQANRRCGKQRSGSTNATLNENEKGFNDRKEAKTALVTAYAQRVKNAAGGGRFEGGTGTNECQEGAACFVERGDGENGRRGASEEEGGKEDGWTE